MELQVLSKSNKELTEEIVQLKAILSLKKFDISSSNVRVDCNSEKNGYFLIPHLKISFLLRFLNAFLFER